MHDLSTIVWVVLVVIGVVSSMVSNARKSRAAAAPQGVPAAIAQPPTAPRGAAPSILAVPLVAAPAPPPPPVPKAPPRARKPVSEPRPVAPVHGTTTVRGMFERGSLVRAIVAAEVLGPPKAMQERHDLWSPRHSEPSI